MPVISIIVPVPACGDGPIVGIAALVGSKTVVLSEKFTGTYVLLASHDDVTFFPILTFESGGEEKIEETLSDSYKSVRVRAKTSAIGLVTLEISGLTSPSSANNFAVLASLPVGASGDSGIVDTAILFPPSGLEGDINFGCAGSFAGTIFVEGSLNGFSFNTIGIFQAGDQQRSLFGVPQRLEFGPLSTPNKTRFVRISVQGQVFEPTTITVGGVVSGVAPSSTTLAEAYANGLASADQTMILLDGRGGTVTLDGGGLTGAFPYTLSVLGNQYLQQSLAVGVDAGMVPSARVHVAGGSLNAGSASLKLDAGFLMTVPEPGSIESTNSHLYWTDAGGIRWQLDGGGGGGVTLTQAYSLGTMASDQTFTLLDVKGGGLTIDGTNVGFAGNVLLGLTGPNGVVVFPTVGGFWVASSIPIAAAVGAAWDEVLFDSSVVVLTGGPTVVTTMSMVRTGSATIDGPGNTVTDAYNLSVGAEPTGTATVTRAWSLGVSGKTQFKDDLAVGLVGAPSAWIHVVGGTAAAGSAPIKIDPGTLMAGTESGAVESDGTHLYWTTAGGTRLQLDNGAVGVTLAVTYTSGSAVSDQTFSLLDANGGGLVVDATAAGFTGASALVVDATSGGVVSFPRVGGLSVQSSVSVAAAPGATWNEVNLAASTVTLTGGPATATSVAMVRVGTGTINGPGDAVTDAYDLLVDAAPAGTASLTRAWSLGVAGAVQLAAGLVLGAALAPPGENDLVFGAGATMVSAANSGRLGYVAGASQQFYASLNTGAYVPVLVGPAAIGFTQGSVPFGSATGQLAEDNANLFWDDTDKRLGIGVPTTPTASLHLPAGVATVGGAPLKITHSGTLLTIPEPGAVESDPAHLYWTNAAGARLQLDSTPVTTTLADAYANGSSTADQTLTLLDAEGGMLIVDATAPGFTGTYVAQFKGLASSLASFPTDGGLVLVQGSIDSTLPTTLSVTGGAHTNIVAGTEEIGALFNFSATKTWATGAIATQREVVFAAPTYGFNAASVVTTAATVAITGAPIAGANATITDKFALWVQTGNTALNHGVIITDGGFGVLSPHFGVDLEISNQNAVTIMLGNAGPGTAGFLGFADGAGVPLTLGNNFDPTNSIYNINKAAARISVSASSGDSFIAFSTGATNNTNPTERVRIDKLGHVGIGVALPTAILHLAAGTATAGTASLKIPSGTVLTVTEPGAVEADNNHLYWTNGAGARLQLDDAATTTTLAQAYANGAVAADQTFVLANGNGGGVAVNATAVGLLAVTAFEIDVIGGSTNFYTKGGFDVASSVSVAAAAGSAWNTVNFLTSTLTLTGGPATVTTVSMVRVGTGTINGAGNTVTDAYNFFVDAPPSGTATLSNTWAMGVNGAMKLLSRILIQPAAVTSGVFTGVTQVGAAHTNLTAGTEVPDTNFNLSATKTWATGAIATQRDFVVQARTYTFAAASVVTTAATVAITGAPAAGANATITNPYALWVQSGTTKLAQAAIGTVPNPLSLLHVSDLSSIDSSIGSLSSTAIIEGLSSTSETTNLQIFSRNSVAVDKGGSIGFGGKTTTASNGVYIFGIIAGRKENGTSGNLNGYLAFSTSNNSLGLVERQRISSLGNFTFTQGAAAASVPTMLTITSAAHTNITLSTEDVGANFNFSATKQWATGAITTQREILFQAPTYAFVGASTITTAATVAITGAPAAGANATITTPLALWVQSGSSQFVATQSVVSAAGAVWNGINFAASTLTLTGATTPVTTMNFVTIAAPTITAASAVVTTDFFTCRIGAATFAGVGPASATRNWSLGIDGNTKFGGGQNVKGTDVNVAGPYTILDTDYVLEVRRTATAPISLNLPSIATVGNGHVAISKDSGYNAAANNITLVRNGADTIENVAGNYVQNVTGSAIWLKANATTNNWEIV